MRSDLLETRIQLNRETSDLSALFETHRAKVMQLIEATVDDLCPDSDSQCQSIVLLGAGNCLDVDLPKLSEKFKTIHLVDLDEQALRNACERSGLADDRVKVHAPTDIAEPLLSLTSRDLQCDQDRPDHFINVLQHLSAENAVTDVPESDIVVSLCVLSQIFGSLQQLTHDQHPAFANTLKAIRIGHLRRMLSMLRKGGVAILVTDVVSSDSAPELRAATDDTLPDLVKQLLASKNFFSGTNPASTIADLNVLARLPSGPESVHTIDPWLWELGERTYAVYALRIQKKLPLEESNATMTENGE